MELNIGGKADDEFFRYKMPPLQAKVEGRGNGIKTRIVNCAQVAKALKRPPGYVCKFFGCELGAQTKINEETGEYIVNGAHTVETLSGVLQKFIQMFVLCRSCGLPETDLKVNVKSHSIKAKCTACGHVEVVDLTHKLCSYIFSNPPPKKRSARSAGTMETDGLEDMTKSKRKSKSKESATIEEHPKSSSRKSKKKPSEENANGGSVSGNSLSEVMKKVAVNDKKHSKKKEQINSVQETVAVEEKMEKPEEEKEVEVGHPVSEMINQGMGAKKITNRVKELTPYPAEQASLLFTGFLRDVYMEVIESVIESLVKAMKMLEIAPGTGPAICSSLDEIAETELQVVSKLIEVVKRLYDDDIVEEDHIREWYEKSKSPKAKEVMTPLVKWLEDAEEESEEE
mmetsp:Transcript_34712/g.136851  ORF Transcript_34712/g.136851 Transcript_34712/m.136851 type:complete len:398 (-) Transcript_34712:2242-3435(-)